MNDTLKSLVRTHYLTLQGYVSAGMEADKADNKVFMNANENPFELPGLEEFNRYPEPQPKALIEAYSNLYDVSSDQILATRGADEALAILTKLFCEPHKDSIVTCPPTFGMYDINGRSMPARVVEIALIEQDGTYALDVENIINAAKDESVKLIFLCSPNNPTGNIFPREDLLRIARETQGHAAVIADETYIEFAEADSLTSALSDHSNLIILRTLSKSYAMAGMRMGCLIANDNDFIQLARSRALDAYPLPRGSVNAALKAMSPQIQKIAQDNIAKLLSERERLHRAFAASNAVEHVYPSDANFLLIKMPRAKDFINACAAQNIIIRDFSNKQETKNCVRISCGLPEQNDRVVEILGNF